MKEGGRIEKVRSGRARKHREIIFPTAKHRHLVPLPLCPAEPTIERLAAKGSLLTPQPPPVRHRVSLFQTQLF